jgi:hypothetical protein
MADAERILLGLPATPKGRTAAAAHLMGRSYCTPDRPHLTRAYRYCGKTDGHCLDANGCQNGCKDGAPVSNAPTPTLAATRPSSTTTTGEPVLGKPSSVVSAPPSPIGVPTVDGSCGAKFGNTICGNWAQGACCSMYGYCGNTTAHCGEGCQNGPCAKVPGQPAPAASPAPAAQKPGLLEI